MENINTYKLHQTGPETQTILDQVNTNTADIAQLRALYKALTQNEPVIIQPADTWPVADPEENVIYRVIDRVNTPPESYSDYMWNGTTMVLMATYDNAIDNVPTAGSDNLVKSGGVSKVLNKLPISDNIDIREQIVELYLVGDNVSASNIYKIMNTYVSGTRYALNIEDANGTLICQFDNASILDYTNPEKELLRNNVLILSERNNSGVTGYAFVDFNKVKSLSFHFQLNSDRITTLSVNPIIKSYLEYGFVDDVPTVGSNNLVRSGGVYNQKTFVFTDSGEVNNCIHKIYIKRIDTSKKYKIRTLGYLVPMDRYVLDIYDETDTTPVLQMRWENGQVPPSLIEGDFSDNTGNKVYMVVDWTKAPQLTYARPSIDFNIYDCVYDSNFQFAIESELYRYVKEESLLGTYIEDNYTVLITSSSTWKSTDAFVPKNSRVTRVKGVMKIPAGNSKGCTGTLYISNGGKTASSPFELLGRVPFTSPGNETIFDFTFDPAYYAQYKNPAWTQFAIWFATNGDGTSVANQSAIFDFEILDALEHIDNSDIEELLPSIDRSISSRNTSDNGTIPNELIAAAPNGNKYIIRVANDGSLSTMPLVPNKVVYFGNSLLFGTKEIFGLAASASNKDYYYLINQFLLTKNANLSVQKYKATTFEGAETIASANSAITGMVGQLAGDEDLVVIQLGDNVNSVEKVATFEVSCKNLIVAVKMQCPNARIVWMGMWYGSEQKYDIIKKACFETGTLFVTFADIIGNSANSYIGQVVSLGSAYDSTMNGVSSVVEDSGNLTITFTVNSKEYSATIPVNSYSLNGTTLTYNSEKWIVDTTGAASHPGDAGFVKIANKFLYMAGFVYTKEFYD